MEGQSIEIHDYSAGKYFRRLEAFLGSEGIEQRLASIELELHTEQGMYLREWVYPRLAWWLGFRDARGIMARGGSFRRAVQPLMELPLMTAAELSLLHSSMPEWKSREFASRLLTDDILDPTLFEIHCAAHFASRGYKIQWFESQSKGGRRTPEFIAKKGEIEVEVECKAKKADAGRRMERASFYRTVDQLIPVLRDMELAGRVYITVPARLSTSIQWRDGLARTLRKHISLGSGATVMTGGEHINWSLQPANGSVVSIRELTSQVIAEKGPYAHVAIFGAKVDDHVKDPVTFRLESAKKDAFLDSVLDSLRDAEAQFTGGRTAIIFCFLPEIASFEGLQFDSAVNKMTDLFFDKYARKCINAVCYVSEAKREVGEGVVQAYFPAVTFRNPNYDSHYGENIPVYG